MDNDKYYFCSDSNNVLDNKYFDDIDSLVNYFSGIKQACIYEIDCNVFYYYKDEFWYICQKNPNRNIIKIF